MRLCPLLYPVALRLAVAFLAIPVVARGEEPFRLVVWNQYNGQAKDRGTRSIRVDVFNGNSVIWQQARVEIPWAPGADTKAELTIPSRIASPDRIRLTVLQSIGSGGGLSEIELYRGEKNIARQCMVAASGYWHKDPRFAPRRVIDGITTSRDMYAGYWLLPDDKPGWIELRLPRK